MREYRNGDIVVFWRPELCTHARSCVRLLPQVFNPDRRPWVDLSAASPLEVLLTVDRCPSGALTYALADGSRLPPDAAAGPGRGRPVQTAATGPSGVIIRVSADGPLIVEGEASVEGPDGKVIREGDRLTLCRCGLSGDKPFCDGSHATRGWKADQT